MALIGREGGKAEFLAPVDSIERPATRVPEYLNIRHMPAGRLVRTPNPLYGPHG